MDIDNLTDLFHDATLQSRVSESFLNEINYICTSVINYYQQHCEIYTDVLDILCHCGYDLAYDMSPTFHEDCKWFASYGKVYIYNYIVTRTQIRTLEEYMKINELIIKIKDIYNI